MSVQTGKLSDLRITLGGIPVDPLTGYRIMEYDSYKKPFIPPEPKTVDVIPRSKLGLNDEPRGFNIMEDPEDSGLEVTEVTTPPQPARRTCSPIAPSNPEQAVEPPSEAPGNHTPAFTQLEQEQQAEEENLKPFESELTRIRDVAAWLCNARAWELQKITERLANNAIFCTFHIGPADDDK